jgi:hypothetical protein
MSLYFQAVNITGAAPVLTYASTASTGGTLADSTTYFYRVSAIMESGSDGTTYETLAVAQGAGQAVSSGTATNTVTITWTAVPGATGYRVYGRLTGAAKLIATLGNVLTFTDTGATAYPLSTTVVPVASTFLAGNYFGPGVRGFTPITAAATPDLTLPVAGASAQSQLLAGQPGTLLNLTSGTLTFHLSPDNVTFNGTGYADVAVLTNTFAQITIPNFMYASAAGGYLLSST